MFFLWLDSEIKKKLGLFVGNRSQSIDDSLYAEAYKRVFDETLLFIDENTSQTSLKLPKNEQDFKESFSILLAYLQVIPNWEFRLQQRLRTYLNNWLMSVS